MQISSHPIPIQQNLRALDLKPQFEVTADLDERSFLFPADKAVTQLVLTSDEDQVFIDALTLFNQSRTAPRLLALTLEDAKDIWLARQSCGSHIPFLPSGKLTSLTLGTRPV